MSFAIAEAVVKLSPVIMIGRIPASLQRLILSLTVARGGSIIPTIPTKINSSSSVNNSFSSSGT